MKFNKDDDFVYLRKFWPALVVFPAIFIIYITVLAVITWPVSEWSITKAALLGDSFGLINAFFSGLALIGVVVTVLLQQREMKNTREEFKKSANAQERTAELTALSTLLSEYNHRYSANEKAIKKHRKKDVDLLISNEDVVVRKLLDEQKDIIGYRAKIVRRLEITTNLND